MPHGWSLYRARQWVYVDTEGPAGAAVSAVTATGRVLEVKRVANGAPGALVAPFEKVRWGLALPRGADVGLTLAATGGPLRIERAGCEYLGHEQLIDPGFSEGTLTDRPVTLSGCPQLGAWRVLANATWMPLRVLLTLFGFLVVGAVLLRGPFLALPSAVRLPLALGGGFALLALWTNSAWYLGLPGRVSAWVGLGLCVVDLIARRGRPLALPRAEVREVVGLGSLALAGAAVASWPGLVVGQWFQREAYTDAYYYDWMGSSWLLRSFWQAGDPSTHPQAALLLHPSIDRFTRSGDIASLASNAALTGETLRAAQAVLPAAVLCLLPVLAYASLRVLGLGSVSRWLGAALSVTLASLVGIATNNYLGQFLGVASLLAALLCWVVVETLPAAHRRPWVYGVLGVLVGANLCIYPEQFVLPFMMIAYYGLSAIRGRDLGAVFRLVVIGVSALLSANVAVYSFTRLLVSRSGSDAQALDQIARNHVFPFWNDWHSLPVALGVGDWVGAGKVVLASPDAAGLTPFLAGVGRTLYDRHFTVGLAVAMSCLALLGLGTLARRAWSLKSPSASAMFCAVGVVSVFLVAFGATGNVYLFGKFALTASVFLPILLAAAVDGLGDDGRLTAWLRSAAVAVIAVACLTATWITWYDNTPYMLSRRFGSLYSIRSHVQALDGQVTRFSQLLEARPAVGGVVFIGPNQRWRGSDHDRVQLAWLMNSVGDKPVYFTGAINMPYPLSPSFESLRATKGLLGVDLAVVFAGEQLETHGLRPVRVILEEQDFTVYEVTEAPIP
jgi:hypothetical protein